MGSSGKDQFHMQHVGHRHIAGVLGRSGDKDREAENHRSGVEIFHTEKDCLLAVLINV